MSTFTHKQPVVLVQQTVFGYDNSELNRHPLNYEILGSDSASSLVGYNNEVSNSVIQGNQQHIFNNLQFQLNHPDNFTPIPHSRKDSVCQFESTPRVSNDVAPLSLNELSAGIMSQQKLNKSEPRYITGACDWRRMDSSQFPSPSSPSSLSPSSPSIPTENNG
ncbi:hypothetical protein BGZ76_004794, partial [Entomortierella beljakovae]